MITDTIDWFIDLSFVFQLALLGLGLAAVQQFRQGYIGRVAIAGAAILVIQQAYPRWHSLSEIWQVYTGLAGVFGVIAGVSYLSKTSLSTEFYKIALLLYGAVPVILVLLLGFPR